MKVLWFTSSHSPRGRALLDGVELASGSGNWIDDEASRLVERGCVSLVQISSSGKVARNAVDGHIEYVDLGIGPQGQGRRLRYFEISKIENALEVHSPDVVQVWGTETSFSTYVLKCARDFNLPAILCPQGLISSLCHFPNGHLSSRELCGFNLLNWLKMPLFNRTKAAYRRQLPFEQESIENASYILSDNRWTFDYCRCFNPRARFLSYPLPLNGCFRDRLWNIDACEPHSIMTVSMRSSYKGQHVLLRAVARLKPLYPDIKVFFPATAGKMRDGFSARLTQTPYVNFLRRIIVENDLQRSAVFLDRMDPSDLADRMLLCGVFVNPSVIESNCMSLREAMMLGMPCVSAFSGSIQEYLDSERDGVLYRYEEDELLARAIARIFEDADYAQHLGACARGRMVDMYQDGQDDLVELYRDVIGGCRV